MKQESRKEFEELSNQETGLTGELDAVLFKFEAILEAEKTDGRPKPISDQRSLNDKTRGGSVAASKRVTELAQISSPEEP